MYTSIQQYTAADSTYIDRIIDNKEERRQMIERIYDLDRAFWYAYPSFIALLKNVFDTLWDRASEQNAFDNYGRILDILLDLIEELKDRSLPNNYIDFLIEEFIDIAGYVGDYMGQSWSASRIWKSRNQEISRRFIDMAKSRCQRNDYKSNAAMALLLDL